MPDSARSGSLHDSAASNVEQDGDNDKQQSDEHEAGAPPPKSVDLTAAKSEVELLTAQLAQQRALFHQLQQGAATSAPISASGSMMGLNAELASHENEQGGSDATTDPATTEPAPGDHQSQYHQGTPMHQPPFFPYAPQMPYGFPYQFPPPGFHPHFMGQPNMGMPTPHAVPRDDPYDINNASLCRQALQAKHMNANMDDEEWQSVNDSRECMAHTTRSEAVLDNIDTSEEENSAEGDAY